jgi:hypothetical protein
MSLLLQIAAARGGVAPSSSGAAALGAALRQQMRGYSDIHMDKNSERGERPARGQGRRSSALAASPRAPRGVA